MADFDDDARLPDDVVAVLSDPRVWEAPPDDLGDRVVATVRDESGASSTPPEQPTGGMPRWLRPALLGAAAVVVVLFAGIGLFSATENGSGGIAVALAPGDGGDVWGEAEFEQYDSGVAVELDAPDLPRLDEGRFYEAWVLTADDRLVPVGTFHAGVAVRLWAGVDLDEIVVFTVTREHAEHADSPEQRSSGDVVLTATMPED